MTRDPTSSSSLVHPCLVDTPVDLFDIQDVSFFNIPITAVGESPEAISPEAIEKDTVSSNADKNVTPESGERDINPDSFEMVDIDNQDFFEIGNHDNAPPLATLQQTSNSETIVIPESTRDLQNWYNITSDITTTCKVEVTRCKS